MTAAKYAKKATEVLFIKGKFPLVLDEQSYKDLIEKTYQDGYESGKMEPKEDN